MIVNSQGPRGTLIKRVYLKQAVSILASHHNCDQITPITASLITINYLKAKVTLTPSTYPNFSLLHSFLSTPALPVFCDLLFCYILYL